MCVRVALAFLSILWMFSFKVKEQTKENKIEVK